MRKIRIRMYMYVYHSKLPLHDALPKVAVHMAKNHCVTVTFGMF